MMRRRAVTWSGVAVLFAALTVVMTWPLARNPGTLAPPHQDVFFNMWRLRWIAHALRTAPTHLFDANIYYPEKDTLAYSDAMLLEGLVAAPLAPLNPVRVHNLMMMLPMAASAVALFALCWYLTGSRGAGVIAGTAFAFAPFRFEHIMHMEIQWTVFMPLAFLALHRLLDRGQWRDGLALGASLALQTLSCIYYGIFLACLTTAGTLGFIVWERHAGWRRVLPPLAAAAVLAVVVAGLYSIPYRRVHALVGDRGMEEVHMFSARPANYLNTPVGNSLYGNPGRPGLPERRLYPGAIVTLLAFAGLLLVTPSPRQIVYLLLLVLAFDLSLGFTGVTFPVLWYSAETFRSLRALARLGVFVLMFLSVLAAYGYATMVRSARPIVRFAVCACLVGGMLAEYWTTFAVSEYPASAPPVYRVLARLPKGVVAELPPPKVDRYMLEARRAYFSTFHWFPLVNGYSGNFPPSYNMRMERMADFPSDTSLRQLQRDGVRYVVVHREAYTMRQLLTIYGRLSELGMAEVGTFDDSDAAATLFIRR